MTPDPRYPIYVPSRDRWQEGKASRGVKLHRAATLDFLLSDGVPFHVVVVPSEAEEYAAIVGDERVLTLPSDDYVLRDSRNWIRAHAEARGAAKHWQLDDNIYGLRRTWKGRCIPCESRLALTSTEDFVDRYENVGVAGLNYDTFVRPGVEAPFYLNVHVYSCTLVNHAMPYGWRLVYNDDTDLCLQALAGGWATILMNAFVAKKIWTMTRQGGNTNQLYEDDGRLRMAEALRKAWPDAVKTIRRYGRPQHYVDWTRFDVPLRKREDAAPVATPAMRLREVRPVKSESLRRAAALADNGHVALPDGGAARRTDPPTAREAAASLPRAGSRMLTVLAALMEADGGLTIDEMYAAVDPEQRLGRDSWVPRLGQLQSRMLAEPTGERRVGSYGKAQQVYVPTEHARRLWAEGS